MPRRSDLDKILIVGSGPIVIGQACEFDYSGAQACKALKADGFKVVLVNSNPATIMTDPEFADATYIEPVTPDVIAAVIEKERPDALLPTLGGQTGLNCAVQVAEAGVLEKFNVRMIGADLKAIKKAEDRRLFREAMRGIGLDLPRSAYVTNMKEARAAVQEIGLPLVVRPSFTLGGTGGGMVYNLEEFERITAEGLQLSMNHSALLEESLEGWKEFELEVMRDLKDNVVIVCSIENFDPMGVHTGDSITVAPIQTLTDKEYQRMRDGAIACIREIGVQTGGSNIQFAVNQDTGRMVIIEMNPRVSRSSALASKATGFPIAKIAAKLAVGYTLDEIPNDITKSTPASFEPVIDYCVVKVPRFTFEKFPGAEPVLTTQMKSVGETMAIGRTFKEALQKALRGLETGQAGLEPAKGAASETKENLTKKLATPNPERVLYLREAFRRGMSVEEVYGVTKIDPWFLENIVEIEEMEQSLSRSKRLSLSQIKRAKEMGFSDLQLGKIAGAPELKMRRLRKAAKLKPVYKLVDTCAAEFEAHTPYYYSTYEEENEAQKSSKEKIMILGGGPNRIGQGIEFDYCCVHASFALKELGFETIMVNSNPETVSTDYDTSDRLYFEPLTFEDVMNIVEQEKPKGVILQFGGQTPLNLALPLAKAKVPILGTSPAAIDMAEDRKRFKKFLHRLDLLQPENDTATTLAGARRAAKRIGYPVLVRPSYVLGGRAMEVVHDDDQLVEYMRKAVGISPDRPALIDRFLEDAVEVDVDLVGDGETFVVGGMLEHIEYAGVHSGDAAMVLPPHTLSRDVVNKIRACTIKMARELGVVGLMNVQFAVKGDTVYVLEVNPRASRTVPFISKAIGVPLAKLAAKVMAGKKLKELGFAHEVTQPYICIKESVFPFSKFPGVDILLGPEMKSTGEVMGIDPDFGRAYLKSQQGAGQVLPASGRVFISVSNRDKRQVAGIAQAFMAGGFELVSTAGTAQVLRNAGIPVREIAKVAEGRPNILDMMKNGEIQMLVNTPSGKIAHENEVAIRSLATALRIPVATTLAGAEASARAIQVMRQPTPEPRSLQEYYQPKRS